MEVSLHLNFIRECLRTNKISSINYPFLIFEKIRKKMAHFFALCFIDQLASRVI